MTPAAVQDRLSSARRGVVSLLLASATLVDCLKERVPMMAFQNIQSFARPPANNPTEEDVAKIGATIITAKPMKEFNDAVKWQQDAEDRVNDVKQKLAWQKK
jgi:hypothetical protein